MPTKHKTRPWRPGDRGPWRHQDYGKWAFLTQYGMAYIFFLVRIYVYAILGRPRALRLLDRVGWMSLHYWLDWIGRRFRLSWLLARASTRWGHLYFRLFTADAVCLRGYEPAVTSFLERSCGKVFIDIGANIGRYSLIAARNFTLVVAVEPHPETFRVLWYNANQYKNITPIRAAVSDVDGQAELHLGPHSGAHSLKPRIRPPRSSEGTVIVSSVRLVSLLRSLGLETVDLIKVDVEGAEDLILKDSRSTMPYIKAWIVEVHPQNDKTYIQGLLQKNGYETEWLDELRLHAYKTNIP